MECARHPSCRGRCNRNDTTICPLICIVNGCECPNGTIIDDVKRKCVAPSECSGTYKYFMITVKLAFIGSDSKYHV